MMDWMQRLRGTGGLPSVPTSDWVLGAPAELGQGQRLPKIIAVGGGKGGVGKSLLSANLAAILGGRGQRVLAIDLDLGGANLHTYFGVSAPSATLADAVLHRRVASLADTIMTTEARGVDLITGGQDQVWGAGAAARALELVWSYLAHSQHDYDTVIMDLGAGSSHDTVSFFCAAHLGVITVLPEPTSIENAYMFIRSAMFRLIENVGQRIDQTEQAQEVLRLLNAPVAANQRRSLIDRLRELQAEYSELVDAALSAIYAHTLGVVINQSRSQRDADIGASMELIIAKYFGFQAVSLGYLNYDDTAWKSLRNRRLLVADFPQSSIAQRFQDLARRANVQLAKFGKGESV
jgi:flagellar biosynthesis protein FlhG